MTTSRRDFLEQCAIVLAGTAAGSRTLLSSPGTGYLTGIQLYSVRDDMQRDPRGTLKQLAAMGYEYVEHADYAGRKFYGYPAAEFRKVLADLGLRMPSGHTALGPEHWDGAGNDFTDVWKYTVEDAAIVGQQLVISPWLDEGSRKTFDGLRRFLELFNKSGELCKKSGMKFGYHNHDFEFSQTLNGMSVYDIILQNTDPLLVAHQLDIGNLYNGGAKALDVVGKYPGRIESMHVKDEIASKDGKEKYESTILGAGIVDVKAVIDLARKSGTVHFIIEQESYQGKPPLECVKADLAIMKTWGY